MKQMPDILSAPGNDIRTQWQQYSGSNLTIVIQVHIILLPEVVGNQLLIAKVGSEYHAYHITDFSEHSVPQRLYRSDVYSISLSRFIISNGKTPVARFCRFLTPTFHLSKIGKPLRLIVLKQTWLDAALH
jgi:hypothetical protein